MKRLKLWLAACILAVAGIAAGAYFYFFSAMPIAKTDTLGIAEMIAPRGEPTGLVYLLSDKDGYGFWDKVRARRLVAAGAVVEVK